MQGTKLRERILDAIFVVFALATAGAFTRMTMSRPGRLEIALTVGVWVGFAFMALDRFWLQRRRLPREERNGGTG
jgi:hypothetical protein